MGDALRIEVQAGATVERTSRPLVAEQTPDDRAARAAALRAFLARVDEPGAGVDPADEVDDGAFFRALDESHPDRPGHGAWY